MSGGEVPERPGKPADPKPDVDEHGNWTDPEPVPVPEDTKLVDDREAARETRRHVHHLQKVLLAGIGFLIVFVYVAVLGSIGLKWVTEQFGATLAQMTIPALLTFGGAIVGTLFRGGDDKN